MCTTSAFSRGPGSYDPSHGHTPELPSGVVANKAPGRQIPSKNPNLSKSTPIQDILGVAKWILGVIIKQPIVCSAGARESRHICGFQKEILPLKKNQFSKPAGRTMLILKSFSWANSKPPDPGWEGLMPRRILSIFRQSTKIRALRGVVGDGSSCW